MIQTAEYDLEEPADQLIAIDGDVLDDVLIDSNTTNYDKIFGSIDTYQNPLTLQLSLWVPDQLMATQVDQRRLLEGLVRRGENSRQIFMPNLGWLNFERRLAENMTALANSSGGTILIGVDASKQIVGISPDTETRERLISHILKAALLSSPPVLLSPLIKFRHLATGRHVYRIDVSQTQGRKHRIGSTVFTRRGKVNIKHAQPVPEIDFQSETSPEGFDIDEGVIRDESGKISFVNSQNVAVLDASQGLSNLEIGAYLCGFINSNRADGRIIITNLNKSSSGLLGSIFRSRVSLSSAMEYEIAKITPPLPKPVVERHFIGNQSVAIIHVPTYNIPVALYDGEAYIWKNAHLNEHNIDNLFDSYLTATNKFGQVVEGQEVVLNQATMDKPISPPALSASLINFYFEEGISYDVDYQANVWQSRHFDSEKNTIGHSLVLTAPLRHVSLNLDDDENIIISHPEGTGKLQVTFQDVLVSGRDISPIGNDLNEWFNAIPIYKETQLHFTYKARLNELIRRRRKSSLLRFLVPEISLNLERVNDIAQILADTGFRVSESRLLPTESDQMIKARIHGMRGDGYFDIRLDVGLLCEQTELTRELHYEGWHDSKTAHSSMLDVRVNLTGAGEGIEKEIGRLQMDLYETINQRLQHLRTE